MSLKSLHTVLNAFESQENWRSRQQFKALLACWNRVVGGAVAAQTRPLGVQRGVLHVATSSAAWAQNLAFERQRLLGKLKAQLQETFLPEELVDIRFSAAQWQNQQPASPSDAIDQRAAERDHPSHVEVPTPPQAVFQPAPQNPKSAFQQWANAIHARSQHLPLCPQCQCPTPPGELSRWSMCSLCIAKQWKG